MKMKPSKEYIRDLRDKIKLNYPKSKGTWNGEYLIVKPFKISKAEFIILWDRDCPGVLAEYYGFNLDAKGSNTCVTSLPKSKKPI